MSVVELKYPAVRESFDLGTYDEALRGETLTLLMNPSTRFRRGFVNAQGDEFVEYLACVIGQSVEDTTAQVEDMPPDLLRWLFVGVFEGETFVAPHIITLWDNYAARRVKAWGRPSGNTDARNLPSQADHNELTSESPPDLTSPTISHPGSSDDTSKTYVAESTAISAPS
jgi:hypothetical protein